MNLWNKLSVDAQGLVPAVVQDWRNGSVLMVGFMNEEALERTVSSQHVHFWSRSRQTLWEKGETSGHHLLVKDVFIDCDRDTLLVKAEPVGATCHTGAPSCFFTLLRDIDSPSGPPSPEALGGLLEYLYRTILERKQSPKTDSYVASLFSGGQDRVLKKIAEEAGEVILASKNDKRDEIIYETADLLFHMLIMLAYHGITMQDIYVELAGRMGKSGLRSQQGSAT